MILVTGGAGFIGSNLVASLNERGVTEIAFNDHLGSVEKERNLKHRRYSGIVSTEELFRWLDGRRLEAILHMGAISSTTATDETAVMAANFELPMRLLDWCTSTRTPFIYASSAATYGDGSQGFNDGFIMDFADEAARDRYLPHPAHKAAGSRLVAALEGGRDGLIVFDLEL